ncbi:hypothetical protein [Solirubrobacter soli]|uniref:hypothetical protein n=1 Tax=Solirubrobacter soli TaxID=363832 RepID=UPI000412B939|nr:hypothetical protein [Solirubrobacter soli]
MDAPQPSARLVRAVAAERAELERHRVRLASEADELRAALARIEHGLAEIDERRGLLDRLAPTPPDEIESPDEQDDEGDDGALRGPEIREVAVRLLVDNGRESMHYREWFELLQRAGHEIAGKDPHAVFLTQIRRSPAVRRGTRAGFYELDRGAFHRLRLHIDGLQRELAAIPPTATHDGAVIRARRSRLNTEIGRAERAIEEVARVLGPRTRLAATG